MNILYESLLSSRLYGRYRNFRNDRITGSAAYMRVADYTAGWDLHPTPKIIPFTDINITLSWENNKNIL